MTAPETNGGGPEHGAADELLQLRVECARLSAALTQLAKHFTFVIATMGGSIQVDDDGVAAMPPETHLKAEPNPAAHCTVWTALVNIAQADGAVTEQRLAMAPDSVGRVAVPGEVRTKAGLILTR